MDDASQKSEPLGGVVVVPPNVVLGDLGVQSEKAIHVPGLGEDVRRVAELRAFDHGSFFDIENVFVAKKIGPAGPARQLAKTSFVILVYRARKLSMFRGLAKTYVAWPS